MLHAAGITTLAQARAASERSDAQFEKVRNDAARQILIARNALLFYLALVSIRAAQDIGASDDESPSLSPSLSTREALEPASAARLREAPDQVA